MGKEKNNNQSPDYHTVLPLGDNSFAGEGLIVEKKSKFFASVWEVSTEDEVRDILALEKKKYPDARHYCYAYVIGEARSQVRAADDGEPQGTAGKPILEVIKGYDLTNTCIIVTRIFGGVLLGTGGLTRAYSDAAKEAMKNTEIVKVVLGKKIIISVDYSMSESLKYFLEKENVFLEKIDYSSDVSFSVGVRLDRVDDFVNNVTNMCAGKALIQVLSETKIKEKE